MSKMGTPLEVSTVKGYLSEEGAPSEVLTINKYGKFMCLDQKKHK